VRGGALGRLTAETKAVGVIARGNAARAPVQARVNAAILQAEQRLVGGASPSVTRGVRLEVRAIRTQGVRDSQNAFDTAATTYRAHVPTMTVERKLLGGGDPELAALRVQAKDAAQGFSPTSSVGLAAAKANTQYVKAVGFTGASNLTSGFATYTDAVPTQWYKDWQGRFVTKQGGDL